MQHKYNEKPWQSESFKIGAPKYLYVKKPKSDLYSTNGRVGLVII